MILYLAERLAKELMIQHGIVAPWKFEFDNAKRRFGQCDYTNRVLSLSRYLVEINDEPEVRNVILHEIAHVLCPGQGHNWHWKMKAKSIGCDGERCYNDTDVETPETKYIATCTEGHVFGRMQKVPANVFYTCNKCINNKTELVYTLNPLYVGTQNRNFAKFFRK